MIEGLETILEDSHQPGVAELRVLLQELLDGREVEGCLLDQQSLKPRARRVFRLRFEIDGQARSVVVKRSRPEIARRNQLVVRRWLPAVGLSDSGPMILGSVAERSGACVWQVYADLGQWELDPRQADCARVLAAVDLIAQVHTRFAEHALIGDVRSSGSDFGIHFYESNVRDAIYALEAWQPGPAQKELRDDLRGRLYQLRDERSRRAQAEAEGGGPETLLHGDLWAINVFVIPSPNGLHARLIDWDRVGVGPVSYDLSTFLLRFAPPHRSWVLTAYREAVERAGWSLPATKELNFLFETAEYARYANRIIWPAIALAQDGAQWGQNELEEVRQWFDDFEPVLPS